MGPNRRGESVSGLLTHQGNIGVAGVIAVCLFLAAWPLGMGAWTLLKPESAGLRRAEGLGLGVLAAGCLCTATILPFILRPGPSVFRPTTRATIRIVSPREGEVVRSDDVQLSVRIEGGKLVPFTSKTLVPNEGHLHVWLDHRLVTMLAGSSTTIPAKPGTHRLDVEFVAVDHGPFAPRVRASATFDVEPPPAGG
jgi:hypothetical protein